MNTYDLESSSLPLSSCTPHVKYINVQIQQDLIIGLDKQKNQRKNVIIFLPISFNICFGCSKEPSHWDGSFEYPQHMFWLRNKKIKFPLRILNLSPADIYSLEPTKFENSRVGWIMLRYLLTACLQFQVT